jgi:hypothetical protein
LAKQDQALTTQLSRGSSAPTFPVTVALTALPIERSLPNLEGKLLLEFIQKENTYERSCLPQFRKDGVGEQAEAGHLGPGGRHR